MGGEKSNKSFLKTHSVFILGVIIRLSLVAYSEIQDYFFNIKYTDIDYAVYTDGSREVLLGNAPYERHTYRYTPLLAWMLTPSVFLWGSFGKTLFVLTDIFCAYYMKKILVNTTKIEKSAADTLTAIWVFNPVVMAVSSRGNADTLISLLVLLTIYYLAKGDIVVSAIMFGLAVHFKVYPVIYALPIYFYIDQHKNSFFTADRLKFAFISAGVFIGLFAILYVFYGWEFAYETYFYHLIRKDHRHNYSIFFYYIYLNFNDITFLQSVLTFVPQIAILVAAGVKYYRDITFCMFLQTFIFVMFNKVCTAQYFIWFFLFLPLIFARNNLYLKKKKRLVVLGFIWLFFQTIWNLASHLVEIQGVNTFLWIHIINTAFFIINGVIVVEFIRNHEAEEFKWVVRS